ncbi:hypothetical protein LPJ53_001660 [Coemansia erecta]|uniref:INO80 complex subunit B-like conserved region domain-containing protein n=1 Tax=Coemansia erecta TaxID=147472 RepID=A0A9W7Y4E7_9FUNG|nr:hypothetical protein LPJ53_001660 [Coemansia erecta]
MPPKRRAAKETATDSSLSPSQSSSSASSSSSESDTSDSSTRIASSTRPRRAGVAAQSALSSPANNTRRSSRLSAQTEQSPAPKSSGRLTRGLRQGSRAASISAARGRQSARVAGRGRRRAISSPLSDDSPPAKRARGQSRKDASDSMSLSEDSEAEPTSDGNEAEEDEEEAGDNDDDEDDEEGSEDDSDDAQSVASTPATGRRARPPRGNPSPTRAKLSDSEDQDVDNAQSDSSDEGGNDELKEEEEEEEEENEEEEEEQGEGENEADEGEESKAVAPEPVRASSTRGGRGRGRGKRGPGRPRIRPLSRMTPAAADVADGDGGSDSDGIIENDDETGLGWLSDDGEGSGTAAVANLTRRQRAKLTRDYDEELIELPLDARRSRLSVEEAALIKSEQARRRKFQSQQRAERIKNDTINRLLNKQTSKGRNRVAEDSEASEITEAAPGIIRYVQRRQKPRSASAVDKRNPAAGSEAIHIECMLSLPNDVTIDQIIPGATAKNSEPRYPQPLAECAVDGCTQSKRYTASSLPVCSLEHWKVINAANCAK